MLWEVLHFFVNVVEVAAVIASILIAGLVIATAVFRILSRCLGKLAGPPPGSDSYDDEGNGYIDVEAFSIPSDDASSPESSRPQ